MAGQGPIRIGVLVDADGVESGATKAERGLDKIGKSSDTNAEKIGLFGKASDATSKRTNELADNLKSKLGPAGEVAGGSIDKAVGIINKMPVAALGAAGAAAALVAGMVALGTAAVNAFGTAVAETQQLQSIMGSSAEEASSLAEVFKEVGLSVDDVADVLENFGSATTEDLAELEKMGVQLDKNADGTVNYAGTLENLLVEMAATTDQTKRAELGGKAFGEQWYRLKPLLDKGAISLNDLMDAAKRGELGKIIGDDDIANQVKMNNAIRSIKESFNDILVVIGSELVPILADAGTNIAIFADGLNNLNDKVPILSHALKGALGPLSALTSSAGFLGEMLGGEAKAADDAALATEKHTAEIEASRAQVEAAAQAEEVRNQILKDLKEAEDNARTAHETRVNKYVELITGIDTVAAAERNVQRALIDQAEAQRNLDAAINEHGGYSEQARLAAFDLADSHDSVKQAVAEQAQAIADNQIKQAELQGIMLSTDEKTDILRSGFEQVAATLGPDHPLIQHINGVINQLNTIPRHVPISVTLDQAGITGQVQGIRELMGNGLRIGGDRAMGGPAHGIVNVGERGRETVVLPRGSRVIPNHASGGGGGVTNNITVNQRMSPQELAREIAWLNRFSGR